MNKSKVKTEIDLPMTLVIFTVGMLAIIYVFIKNQQGL